MGLSQVGKTCDSPDFYEEKGGVPLFRIEGENFVCPRLYGTL